ncbi:hypothetical protein RUM44_009492 [Polyplax serrata]|uniref:Uncharacterized protein n=1 Tax=Polyplax serrata TaxID=468196 RepID=A0ABR1ASU8_POLSC
MTHERRPQQQQQQQKPHSEESNRNKIKIQSAQSKQQATGGVARSNRMAQDGQQNSVSFFREIASGETFTSGEGKPRKERVRRFARVLFRAYLSGKKYTWTVKLKCSDFTGEKFPVK